MIPPGTRNLRSLNCTLYLEYRQKFPVTLNLPKISSHVDSTRVGNSRFCIAEIRWIEDALENLEQRGIVNGNRSVVTAVLEINCEQL